MTALNIKTEESSEDSEDSIELPCTPEARAKRLRRLRMLGNLKRKELCENSHVNIHTLIGWENGRFSGISVSGAKRIIHYLNCIGVECTLDWLLYEIGSGPVAGASQAQFAPQPNVSIHYSNDKQKIIDELLYFKSQHHDAVDFMVNDESMLPIYQPGDYVAGVRQYDHDIASMIGKSCIVQTTKGKTFFRQIRPGTKEGHYTLVCLNSEFQQEHAIIADVALANAAPVIWHRKPQIK